MKILPAIKSIIYQNTPKSILTPSLTIYTQFKTRKTKEIFQNASSFPTWLDFDQIVTLQNRYTPRTTVQYDTKVVVKRGEEKAQRILELIGKPSALIVNCLELGTGRGEVSEYLQTQGKQMTAIDIDLKNILEQSEDAGVKYYPMDATDLTFLDESFDLVFSFNSFEHFLEPHLVLAEAIRVLKKGGYLYLCFDPLYYSPWGLHAYRLFTFPYCQCLFSEEMLKDFAETKGISLSYQSLNRWSIEQYRQLWQQFDSLIKPSFYREKYNPFYIDLINEYPSCFKSKKQSFENFVISGIEVLFQKIS